VRAAPIRVSSKAHIFTTAPWQCLYFLPEPQGQSALRETFSAGFGLPVSSDQSVENGFGREEGAAREQP
jgi:hypothetical protein